MAHFSVAAAVADGRAVVADLGLGDPLLVGHSMGGWASLHYATTSPCRALVCLDGPTCLGYAEMRLLPDHPAFVPDPPDVPTDVDSLGCPAMIVLCRGSSRRDEEWMVPFRSGLGEYLVMEHPHMRVGWRSAGHMLVLTHPGETADLISWFLLDQTA